jgi:DNA-binding transcriptional LysR family regulator
VPLRKKRHLVDEVEWLNYHHLLYFWVVAKQGSIVRASAELRLAHPTISGQIHRLEEVLGEKLFARRGRHLVLTEAGRVAYRYADEIFSLGREFVETLKGRASGKPMRLVVGVAACDAPMTMMSFFKRPPATVTRSTGMPRTHAEARR